MVRTHTAVALVALALGAAAASVAAAPGRSPEAPAQPTAAAVVEADAAQSR